VAQNGAFGIWNETNRIANYTRTINLSSIAALNNDSAVYLRLSDNIPAAPNGTGRIDNVLITATAIPEPCMGLVWLCGVARGLCLRTYSSSNVGEIGRNGDRS
jgi:hypothetical protein